MTDITLALTVTEQSAVFLPSALLAVMVAVPAVLAVTRPVADTDATLVLLELQITSRSVALSG